MRRARGGINMMLRGTKTKSVFGDDVEVVEVEVYTCKENGDEVELGRLDTVFLPAYDVDGNPYMLSELYDAECQTCADLYPVIFNKKGELRKGLTDLGGPASVFLIRGGKFKDEYVTKELVQAAVLGACAAFGRGAELVVVAGWYGLVYDKNARVANELAGGELLDDHDKTWAEMGFEKLNDVFYAFDTACVEGVQRKDIEAKLVQHLENVAEGGLDTVT